MRKRVTRVVAAVVASVALWGLAGAADIKIGYLCANFNDTFQTYVIDAAKAFAAKHPDVTLEVMDAQEDVIKQQDQLATMAQQGVDAVIIVPVNTAIGPMVKTAAEARVPLIFIIRNPFDGKSIPENVYYLGADPKLEGYSQMRYVAEKMGGTGNVAILMGMTIHEATFSRTEGVKEAAKEYPGIAVIAEDVANWQRDQGMTITENFITAYGDSLNAVVANNDEMALGAVQALAKAGMADVLVAGIDGTPDACAAIEKGAMVGSVLQDALALGNGGMEMAYKLAKGEKVDQMNRLPATLITKENAGEFKNR